MTKLYILMGIILAIVFIISLFKGSGIEKSKKEYHYRKRNFFLTKAEHEFYDTLLSAVGNEYLIFAQVHLSSLLDSKVVGQNWRGAFRHIDEKSVDFVLCDKVYISPKLVIELDDKTHERPERKERDIEVERILKDAGLPLLRLGNHGRFNVNELAEELKKISIYNIDPFEAVLEKRKKESTPHTQKPI